MKAAAINHGIREENIPSLTSKIPSITGDKGILNQIMPLNKRIDLKIAYYNLSKFSHGMRQSIYRYLDPKFEQEDPVNNWHYPLAVFTHTFSSINQLIKRFGNDTKDNLISSLSSDLTPILLEFKMLMAEVFEIDEADLL